MVRIRDEEPCPCGSGKTFEECHGKKIRERQSRMNHIRLSVIPEPDPGSCTILHFFTGPATGDGADALDCGACGTMLMMGVTHDMVKGNLTVRCLHCFAVNRT